MHTTKWPVLVVEVANAEGRQVFVREGAAQAVQGLMESMGARLAVTEVDPAFVTPAEPPEIIPPSGFRRVRDGAHRKRRTVASHPAPPPQGCTLRRCVDLEVTAGGVIQVLDPVSELSAAAPGRGTLIYTDGSVKGDEVGAGYVVPPLDGTFERGLQMKVLGPQTINRAELTAIYAVLQDWPTGTPCTILSDSLTSLRNIQRWIADPMQFRGTIHEDLLRGVCALLLRRVAHTTLCKIRAHKGHPGNEMADATAKAAADAPFCGEVLSMGLDTSEGGPEARAVYLGDDLLNRPKAQLRPVVHGLLARREGYGQVAHREWSTAEDMDKVASNIHLRPGKSWPKYLVKHVLRLRGWDYVCGFLLWLHAKPAVRPSLSTHCPYGCRSEAGRPYWDTWLHTFLCQGSGSRDMLTALHNDAGHIVAAALARGSMGRWLTLQNTGRIDDEPEQHTTPPWMLRRVEGERGPNKPDFMIVKGWPSTAPLPTEPVHRGGWRDGDETASVELVMLEIKYTNETNFVAKHREARDTYQGAGKLDEKLRAAGLSVRPVQTVVVGHRAGVSESNKVAYAAVGITCKKAQRKLQDDLAVSAMKWAAKIIQHTRKARANRGQGQQQP